jgi:hypothetical protein
LRSSSSTTLETDVNGGTIALMGMFDTVRCRFPLPHHQEAEFQTKDLAYLVLGEGWLGGTMDEYEITEDGRLMRHLHEREWREDPDALLGGHSVSIRDWWEEVPDVHGDVRIYTSEGRPGQPGYRWIEFRVRFTNGRVQQIEEAEPGGPVPGRVPPGGIS